MFRRSKTAEPAPSAEPTKEGGKGRPTPTRREAEAAAKLRAKQTVDRKAAARMSRSERAQHNTKVRAAMKSGDERYLPARDKGPVKKFIRDWVDARICIAELLLPMLLLILVTSGLNQSLSNGLWSATILLVALDSALLVFRLRRELRRRFPDDSTRGATMYALLRSLQLRFIRLPKPQVKLGQKLPEKY